MDNLIWLVVLGAVFYFMMRLGGCGGGHRHGRGPSNHSQDSENPADPNREKNEKKHSGCH